MTLAESLEAVRNGETFEASYAAVTHVLQRTLRGEMTVADYDAAWAELKVRWLDECRARGLLASDQARGGPRVGSNWTGD